MTAVLTHHWLVRVRGGEKVLEACADLVPGAPIYTLVHDTVGMAGSPLERHPIHTSWLQRIPGAARHYPKLLPLLPAAARSIHLPPVDLVLCSDAAIAKAMTPAPASVVVCYCHSPMRYVWDLAKDYGRTLPLPLRPLWSPLGIRLRRADRAAADRVDVFIANSRHVAERIRRHYEREAVVVHPPVDLPESPAAGPRSEELLCVGYHTRYKRLDLAVAAARKLGRKLVVIGEGPDVRALDLHHAPHVELRGWCGREEIAAALRSAAALLFPGEEDFGIVPVEAIAHGCPVVAYGVGGATETVVPGESGVWFMEQTTDALVEAVERCERMRFNPVAMHTYAQRFSRSRFLAELRAVITGAIARGRTPTAAARA